MSDALLDRWADDLKEELVHDLSPQAVDLVARAASVSATTVVTGTLTPALTIVRGAGLATGGTGLAGLSTMAKVGVITLAVTVGTGMGAVTGKLPDPIQSWIAGVVEEIGIGLPTPDDPALPTIPGDEVPVPDLPLDGDPIPIPDLPIDEKPGLELPFEAPMPVPDLPPGGMAPTPALPSDDRVDAPVSDLTVPTVTLPQDLVTPPSLP
jgi:hypothetical protein